MRAHARTYMIFFIMIERRRKEFYRSTRIDQFGFNGFGRINQFDSFFKSDGRRRTNEKSQNLLAKSLSRKMSFSQNFILREKSLAKISSGRTFCLGSGDRPRDRSLPSRFSLLIVQDDRVVITRAPPTRGGASDRYACRFFLVL